MRYLFILGMEKEENINEIRKKLKLTLKIKPEKCEWCDYKPNHSEEWNHKRKSNTTRKKLKVYKIK